jgi:hypothetical protein
MMSDQATSDFEQLKAKPIFMEIMQQGPRDAARVEAVLVAVLESILESVKFAEVRAAPRFPPVSMPCRACWCTKSCTPRLRSNCAIASEAATR